MQVNLEYYKVFYYVVQTGQFTAAAELLSLSQPAISQAIKNLEAQLNTCLFTRTTKGVQLTPEGKILYSHIKKGYETILLGEHQVTQMLNLEAGEIRIGASDMTLQFYLLPYLERFHQQYPQIKVSVTNGPTPETLAALQDGRIDFGVISTPFTLPANIDIHIVKEIEDTLIAGNDFSHLKGRPLSYQELASLPFICLEATTSTRRNLDTMLAQNGIAITPEFELATSDMIVQFTVRNLGIGYVMSEFAAPYIDQGLLFSLQLPNPLPARQFCIATDNHLQLSTAAGTLLEMLIASQ